MPVLRRLHRLLLSFTLLIPAGLTAATATARDAPAPTEWQAGVARARITPPDPVVLAGYATRREPLAGVVQDLYVKALALKDNTGHRSVLITCDFIGLRAVNAEPICDRIMAASGLGRAQILINSSHTHTGPSQAESPTSASYLPPEEVRALHTYTVWLQERIVETALAALDDMHPAKLGHDTGVAPFVMNRREPTKRGIVLGHHPRGPADRSVPTLRVTGPDGRLRAVVFGAACHNTTIPPGDNQVCGDFAGFAQEHIESAHPGAQAMFMQGCGGDAGPYPTGSLALSRQHGATLGGEVNRLLDEDAFAPVRGPLRTAYAKVDLPLAEPMTDTELATYRQSPAAWQRWVGEMMTQRRAEGRTPPTHYTAPVGLWQFGDDLTLVGLSGEVVVDYVALLEQVLGPLNLWIAAYCNDVFGYVPSARVLREGGYETRGLYGGDPFSPQVEPVLVEAVRALAQEAGRATP